MIATANEIMGSLIYRTSQELNKNTAFLEAIRQYYYWPSIAIGDKFNLWHFPGTQQEISQAFKSLGKDSVNGRKLKYPAVLSFQGIPVEHNGGIDLYRYNLAIVAPVLSEWTTQQREEQVYKLVLAPIERELIKQIEGSEFFQVPIGGLTYASTYIPTTGNSLNSAMNTHYGDFIDAIELPNLSIKVLSNICASKSSIIIEESKKVTDEIKNIVK